MSIVHGLTLDQRLLLAAASSWCATTMYVRAASGDAFFGSSSGRLRYGDHITQPSWLTDGGYRYEGRALISPSLRAVAGHQVRVTNAELITFARAVRGTAVDDQFRDAYRAYMRSYLSDADTCQCGEPGGECPWAYLGIREHIDAAEWRRRAHATEQLAVIECHALYDLLGLTGAFAEQLDLFAGGAA